MIELHNVDSYLYAGDGKPNDHLLLFNIDAVIPKMENCVDAVHKWCASKCLKLNASKTEVTWFGTNAYLKKLKSVYLRLRVEADGIAPVDAVGDLDSRWLTEYGQGHR